MESRSVLLIDDDSDFLAAVELRCQFLGMDVRRAGSLLTAAAALEQRLPDVICLDVELPTGNGLHFCRMLRDDQRTSAIPVVILTGGGKPGVRNACHELGAHYVAKSSSMWGVLEPLLKRLGKEGLRIDHALAPPGTPRPCGTHVPRPIVSMKQVGPTSKAIVVVNHGESVVQEFADRCHELGCCIYHASNGLDAIGLIRRVLPDLVCVDVSPSTSGGLGVCDAMATDEHLRLTPVILLAGPGSEVDVSAHDLLSSMSVTLIRNDAAAWDRLIPVIAAHLRLDFAPPAETNSRAGEDQSQAKQEETQEAVVCERLIDAMFFTLGGDGDDAETPNDAGEPTTNAHNSAPPAVLCIDDDDDFFDSISMRFSPLGVNVLRAGDGMHGYRSAFVSPVRAIVLDYMMPNGRGDYILTRLKDNPITKDIPVVVVTGERDRILERRMYALGAHAYLTKPLVFQELQEALVNFLG